MSGLFDPTCTNCNFTLLEHWRKSVFTMSGDPPETLCAHCGFTRIEHWEYEGDLVCVRLKTPCPEPFVAMLVRGKTFYRRADRTIWDHILSGPV